MSKLSLPEARERRKRGWFGGVSAATLFVLGFGIRKLILQQHSLLDLWLGSLIMAPLFSGQWISTQSAWAAPIAIGAVLLPKITAGMIVGWLAGVRAYRAGDDRGHILRRILIFVLIVEVVSLIGYTVG